ncbi:MAG TPA: hypothetical protein VM935_15225 [Chitinophagaceae bacterium]|nr:hypothetical protein [Chitinophagaceae bacterium]
MKSIHQFKRLSMEQKLLAIDRGGIDLCLALFRTDESCMLYALQHFYVEIIFTKTCRHIKKIRCFTTVRELTPYLKQIDIDELTIRQPHP